MRRAVYDNADIHAYRQGPEIFVPAAIQLMKTKPRAGGIDLCVKSRLFDQFLLIDSQLAQTGGEGVGYAEFHYDRQLLVWLLNASTAFISASLSGACVPHSFQKSRVALLGFSLGVSNLIRDGNRTASPSINVSPVSKSGKMLVNPDNESGIKRLITF